MVESQFDQQQQALTIKLLGDFDFRMHRAFLHAVRQGKSGIRYYNIDFSKVLTLDSAAFGMLLLLRDHARQQQAGVRLLHVNESVQQQLQNTNLYHLFEMV